MRKEQCLFSGAPVHPGHGKRYVPTLVQSTRPVLIFANAKSRKLYLKKKNPRVIRWTVTYRRLNKKMANVDQIKKKARKAKKAVRPIVGADLETIRQKKAQRETIRIASKEAALKELEERKKKRAEAAKNKAAAGAPPPSKTPKAKQPKMNTGPKQGPKKGGR
eukprot:CAMPEP_0174285720 /NCGR_PEP_ID=MMETSP0809-20121228/9508_1 /TAXON_ID=73025 ORGANISM="Eutreptiella gymnastica-like, Strain CCMP1594" /NCGR_SAMPLE_ID=MMETSP0809 /ASSEMBLY_ACC=CAM_ASM_000658 /LENGTH=162 /DNA_ID=CAMNT_0015381565 /DNA_START=24 /DNA_END=512 /DNA_ORIENTATION=-